MATKQGSAPSDTHEGAGEQVPLLLQHRHELETERISLLESVSKLRSGGLSLAVVLVLAAFLLERFLYVATTERWTMAALPLIVLVATGLLDLLHYHPQVQAKADRVQGLEDRLRDVGGSLVPDDPDGRSEMARGLLLAYYLLPTVALLVLAVWRLA